MPEAIGEGLARMGTDLFKQYRYSKPTQPTQIPQPSRDMGMFKPNRPMPPIQIGPIQIGPPQPRPPQGPFPINPGRPQLLPARPPQGPFPINPGRPQPLPAYPGMPGMPRGNIVPYTNLGAIEGVKNEQQQYKTNLVNTKLTGQALAQTGKI
jgi:hypothetical protein